MLRPIHKVKKMQKSLFVKIRKIYSTHYFVNLQFVLSMNGSISYRQCTQQCVSCYCRLLSVSCVNWSRQCWHATMDNGRPRLWWSSEPWCRTRNFSQRYIEGLREVLFVLEYLKHHHVTCILDEENKDLSPQTSHHRAIVSPSTPNRTSVWRH